MIAYVDPDRVFDYVAPQLERLEARSHLFIVTVRAGQAIAIDAFADGEHSAHDTDITHLLPRLGCQDDFARWAETPRVLTPTDVDLLCYALGLEMPSDAPLPPRKPVDGARAGNLLNAVYDEPDSDDVRLVYADHLQEHDEPHGQLIALQIARARHGGKPTAGERALVQWHGGAIAQPLTPYLRTFELRRGFLAACAVDDAPPDDILASRAWSTVESIETHVHAALSNPQLAAVRRAATDTAGLLHLVRAREPQPYETLVGPTNNAIGAHNGIAIDDARDWRALTEIGALTELHTLALHVTAAEPAAELVEGRLGAQLAHLDLILAPGVEPRRLRAAFDASTLRRLVVRLWRGDDASLAVAIERGRPHRLQLQLRWGQAFRAHHHPEVLSLVRAMGSGLSRIEIAVIGAQPHLQLRDSLRAIFPEVETGSAASWWAL